MKRFYKVLFVYLICLVLSGFTKETYATSEFMPGTKCPISPNRSLASICGVVKSSNPTRVKNPKTGLVTYEAPKGVPGVTVAVYECDSQSPSCKSSGNLVHLFSSTSTDKDGMFYLWSRKLDTYIEPVPGVAGEPGVINVPKNVTTKTRYLVFKCGEKFAGMQTIPSFLDFTYIVQEVSCPPFQAYVTPENKMSLLTEETTIASQPVPNTSKNVIAADMGNDYWTTKCKDYYDHPLDYPGMYDKWCDITSENYTNHLTVQTYFGPQKSAAAPNGLSPINNSIPAPSFNFDLFLENADPRFNYGEPGGSEVIKTINLVDILTGTGKINPFEKGSYWSKDCNIKYAGSKFEGTLDTDFCMQSGDTPGQYADKLYTDSDFLVQNKLPNIPPLNSLKFYKEFPSRQDITEFIQDPTEAAKFNGSQFSNCIGSVFLRKDSQDAESKYVACSKFQKCNEVINKPGEGFLNNQSTLGPASHFVTPTTFKDEYLATVDLHMPICKRNPDDKDEKPIEVHEIQPPWETSMDGYEFDKSYWSIEFIKYFGKNNKTAKYGVTGTSWNDSFYPPVGSVNEKVFETAEEAGGQPLREGLWPMTPSGRDKPNNSMVSSVQISSNTDTGDSSNSLTNFMSSPLKATDKNYENNVLYGYNVPTIGSEITKLKEWSKVNSKDGKTINEMPVFSPVQDENIISNSFFKSNLEPDQDHHPLVEPDVTVFNLGDIFNGTVTPTTAIYLTNPAIARMEALKTSGNLAQDTYDSYLTTKYGSGKLGFSVLNDLDIILKGFWNNLTNDIKSKSFLDRKNAGATLKIPKAGDGTISNTIDVKNDLQTKFPLSEENFLDFFPLPKPPSEEGQLLPEDWGGNQYYGWHIMPPPTEFPINIEETCNTSQEDPVQISRTCRVDSCEVTQIKYTCPRTWDSINNKWVYGSPQFQPPSSGSLADCTPSERLVCAQNQYSCVGTGGVSEVTCLTNTYDPSIFSDARSEAYCNASHYQGPFQILVHNAPSCVVSMAGPYTSGGTLFKDSEFIVETGVLPDNDSVETPPQKVDSLLVAGNEQRKIWQDPFSAALTHQSGALISGDASIRNIGTYDITNKVDTIAPGGGTQNYVINRAAFGAPLQTKDPTYNKINIHCNVDDQNPDGTFISNVSHAEEMGEFKEGNWVCDVNEPPDPEVVDLNAYTDASPVNDECKFNPSDACVFEVYPKSSKSAGEVEVPFKFSKTFVDILNAAATRMNIPASVLMSYSAGIHKTSMYGYYFSTLGERELKDASFPWYGALPGCNEMNTAAVGPYDLLQGWFNQARYKNQAALEELATGRSKTASRCNFLDSTFIIAAMIKSVVQAPLPDGCADWDWDDASEALQRIAWGYDLTARPDGNIKFGKENDSTNTKNIFEACRY